MVWAQAASAAFSIGSSLVGANKADKAAKKAAKSAGRVAQSRTDEIIRQQTRQAGYQKGAARAAVGASNIQMSGSAKRYINQLDFENMREIAYTREAGRLEQQAIKNGAQGAGDAMLYGAVGQAIGQAAGALTQYGLDKWSNPAAITTPTASTSAGRSYAPTSTTVTGLTPTTGTTWNSSAHG